MRMNELRDQENAVDGAMLADLSEEELCAELGLLKLQAARAAIGQRLGRAPFPAAVRLRSLSPGCRILSACESSFSGNSACIRHEA